MSIRLLHYVKSQEGEENGRKRKVGLDFDFAFSSSPVSAPFSPSKSFNGDGENPSESGNLEMGERRGREIEHMANVGHTECNDDENEEKRTTLNKITSDLELPSPAPSFPSCFICFPFFFP